MVQTDCPELRIGRIFLFRLPSGTDPLLDITGFCIQKEIKTAIFSLGGIFSTVTTGVYDAQQQVYVTHTEETPMEILNCSGNITVLNGSPFPCCTLTLADKTGRITGGRLFSPTRNLAVEISIRELTGPPIQRTYLAELGLDLWPVR